MCVCVSVTPREGKEGHVYFLDSERETLNPEKRLSSSLSLSLRFSGLSGLSLLWTKKVKELRVSFTFCRLLWFKKKKEKE